MLYLKALNLKKVESIRKKFTWGFKAFRFQNFLGEHAPRPVYRLAPSALAKVTPTIKVFPISISLKLCLQNFHSLSFEHYLFGVPALEVCTPFTPLSHPPRKILARGLGTYRLYIHYKNKTFPLMYLCHVMSCHVISSIFLCDSMELVVLTNNGSSR